VDVRQTCRRPFGVCLESFSHFRANSKIDWEEGERPGDIGGEWLIVSSRGRFGAISSVLTDIRKLMAVCSSSSCVPADPAGSDTGKPGPDRPCFFSMMSSRQYCAHTRFSARARLTLNFRDISAPYYSNGVPTRTGSGQTVFETVSLSIDNGHLVQCSVGLQ
jgi:hypothetical protein